MGRAIKLITPIYAGSAAIVAALFPDVLGIRWPFILAAAAFFPSTFSTSVFVNP
jgi:hypothetical protein